MALPRAIDVGEVLEWEGSQTIRWEELRSKTQVVAWLECSGAVLGTSPTWDRPAVRHIVRLLLVLRLDPSAVHLVSLVAARVVAWLDVSVARSRPIHRAGAVDGHPQVLRQVVVWLHA